MSIQCDLCGGQLIMEAGGKNAVCEVCGMKYSLMRLREKAQEAMAGRSAATPVPAAEPAPAADPTPATKPAPATEAVLAVEPAPATEAVPAVEPDPVVEAAPTVEAVPVVEAVPTVEAADEAPAELRQEDVDPDVVYDVEEWTAVEEPDEPERPEDFVCRENSGLRVLMHYTGRNRVVTIPGDVECLGEWEGIETTEDQSPGNPGVFLHPERIQRVILPEGLCAIGPLAFRGCINLEELVLPASLEWFSADMSDCTSLRSLVIKSAGELDEIDLLKGAFKGCTALREVTLPTDNTLKCIPPSMFQDCSSLQEITIPWSVVAIHEDAFSGCTQLSQVHLPAYEMLIHPSAFAGCPYQPPVEAVQPRKLSVCPLCGGKISLLGYCKSCGAPMRLTVK